MSPAVDYVNLPLPIDPTSVAPAPSPVSSNTPSFQDHLDAAGQRAQSPSNQPDPSDPSNRDGNTTPSTRRKDAKSGPSDGNSPAHAKQSKDDAKPNGDASANRSGKADDKTTASSDAKPHDKGDDKQDQDASADSSKSPAIATQAASTTAVVVVKQVDAAPTTDAKSAATTDESKVDATAATNVVAKQIATDAQTAAATAATNAKDSTSAADAASTTTTQVVAATAAAAAAATKGDASTKTGQAANSASAASATQSPAQAAAAAAAAATAPVAAVDPTAADGGQSNSGEDKKQTADDGSAKTATQVTATDLPPAQVVSTPAAIAIAAVTAPTVTIDAKSDPKPDAGRDKTDVNGTQTTPDRTSPADPPRPSNNVNGSIVTRGKTTDEPAGSSQIDRARLIQRVAKAVQTATDRGGELKLRLSPPELGSIRLHIEMNNGTLTARVETETHDARQVLVDSLPQLRERLSDQNIQVERFDIDLFNSGNGGLGANNTDRRFEMQGDGSSRQGSGNRKSDGVAAAPAVNATTTLPTAVDGRLNVLI